MRVIFDEVCCQHTRYETPADQCLEKRGRDSLSSASRDARRDMRPLFEPIKYIWQLPTHAGTTMATLFLILHSYQAVK